MRSWTYPRPLAALYLCALPVAWASAIGFAITSFIGRLDTPAIFGIPFAVAGTSLTATAFYLLAHDRSLADKEFIPSWPLPRGWRASWGRVLLAREVSFALQAFAPPPTHRPEPHRPEPKSRRS